MRKNNESTVKERDVRFDLYERHHDFPRGVWSFNWRL